QPNADFTVSGTAPASDISKQLSVSPLYRVSIMNAAADQLTLRMFPKTGLFSGSFRDANRHRSFGGVLLQGKNIGTGLFLGENKTGAVLLKPRPTQP
ncbi:MAG: hypothetical protein JWL59_4687, partial [Chthoniobacteraceae bacterium]|nr:hypothetical protein [Chthoniobacteraceae bacterium]